MGTVSQAVVVDPYFSKLECIDLDIVPDDRGSCQDEFLHHELSLPCAPFLFVLAVHLQLVDLVYCFLICNVLEVFYFTTDWTTIVMSHLLLYVRLHQYWDRLVRHWFIGLLLLVSVLAVLLKIRPIYELHMLKPITARNNNG